MIPSAKVATVESNFTGQQIAMSLDESALVHLAQVLSNLYSDVEGSVLRELITNAIDSHIDAGQTRAVEVTLPNRFTPYLVIRDFGVGLSLDDMVNIYSKYGASTKRTSNTTTGSLGLGSKSPLAYTNAFTVVSVKGGMKVTAAVSLNEQGIGVIDIVDTSATTDHNGVEIRIPTKHGNEFASKALHFAKFLEPGVLLINGVDSAGKFEAFSDNIVLEQSANRLHATDYVVMGSVAYPTVLHATSYRSFNIIAHVPMGSVDFTPNREALMDTDLTRSTLQSMRDEFMKTLVKRAADTIENAASHGEAVDAYFSMHEKYGNFIDVPDTYRGEAIPSGRLKKPDGTYVTATVWNPSASRYSVDNGQVVYISAMAKTLRIVNYPYTASGINSGNKAKIRGYMSDNGLKHSRVMLFSEPELPGGVWTKGMDFVTWDHIKETQKSIRTSNKGNGYSRNGGHDVYDASTKTFSLRHDIADTDEIIYFSPTDSRYGSRDGLYRREDKFLCKVQEYFPTHRIVMTSKNRQEKLNAGVKSAIHIGKMQALVLEKMFAKITDADKEYLTLRNVRVPQTVRNLSSHDLSKVKDTDMLKAIESQKAIVPASIAEIDGFAPRWESKLDDLVGAVDEYTFIRRYPLLQNMYTSRADCPEDLLLYINGKYDQLVASGQIQP